MRKQLVKTVTDLLRQDPRVVLLLGDIGVHGFREAFQEFPKRVYNIGILEQSSISLAAGLALDGMIPFFHTIAPFLVERALEQLKLDFGYQGLGGNFISVGASYDYASLGCSHHCPGDVAALSAIPGMEIMLPGHPEELDVMLRRKYNNGRPTYFRLSEQSNEKPCGAQHIASGRIHRGRQGAVVAFGPMLDRTLEACKGLDVDVWYLKSFNPATYFGKKVIVVEPFYEGTSAHLFPGSEVHSIGVPRKFLHNYGTVQEQDQECGLTTKQIRERIEMILGMRGLLSP